MTKPLKVRLFSRIPVLPLPERSVILQSRDRSISVLVYFLLGSVIFVPTAVVPAGLAILFYYFYPRYSYDNEGVWLTIAKWRKKRFSWDDVEKVEAQGDSIIFVLKDGREVKLSNVVDMEKIYRSIKNLL